MKRIRITEAKLKSAIYQAVRNVLSEARLDYDEDNFSGRNDKNDNYYDFVDSEGYLDDPERKSDIEHAMDDDDYYQLYGNPTDAENDYSWNLFNHKAKYPGAYGYYDVADDALPMEKNMIMTDHELGKNWTGRELRNRDRMMSKWVNGEREAEQIGDSWEDVHDL